jgi:torulene dioxygenase
MIAKTETPTTKHFNDWPNAVGLDVSYEEREPVQLEVEGKIPSYVSGTLFRTGLGPRKIANDNGSSFVVNHWFDNFSQVHRFGIDPSSGTVTYNSRLTSDGLIEEARKVR